MLISGKFDDLSLSNYDAVFPVGFRCLATSVARYYRATQGLRYVNALEYGFAKDVHAPEISYDVDAIKMDLASARLENNFFGCTISTDRFIYPHTNLDLKLFKEKRSVDEMYGKILRIAVVDNVPTLPEVYRVDPNYLILSVEPIEVAGYNMLVIPNWDKQERFDPFTVLR